MIKRLIFALMIVTALVQIPAAAQDYEVPEIKLSKDKVRVNGKSYYAHVATEKQTLYSISKAYNVSLQDIYDANRNLDLENSGLKAGQVILIPVAPAAKSGQSSELDRWLFPGKGKKPEPAVAEPPVTEPVEAPVVAEPTVAEPVEAPAEPVDTSAAFVLDIPSRIQVSVVLPFTNSRLSDNSVDFYSGLLLAAREFGRSGTDIDIHAIDIRDTSSLSPASLQDSHIIFGPITVADMKAVTARCPEGKFVISPLDPQASVLPATLPVIQTPTPVRTQNIDIVNWAIEETMPGDSLILITTSGTTLSEGSACIVEALKQSGVHYTTIRYELLQGLSMQKSFEAHTSQHGVTRYLIAADDEAFVNDAVRNVNLMAFKKHEVALYAPSRIRSFSMIETEYLHNVNTRISAAYFIDYTKDSVGSFVKTYRALFNAEPNSFAFHGYDTMHFFVNLCRSYGTQWPKVIGNYTERGFQTDFSFVKEDGGPGYLNSSVRRILYTQDFQIVLL